MTTARNATGRPGEKPGPQFAAGGRHRPFWKLTDDPMLRHTIRRSRQDRRQKINKPLMKGIAGVHTGEQLPYPSDYHREEAERKRRQPGRSGSEKRRARKGGKRRGPGGGGIKGAGERLAATLKEARP